MIEMSLLDNGGTIRWSVRFARNVKALNAHALDDMGPFGDLE